MNSPFRTDNDAITDAQSGRERQRDSLLLKADMRLSNTSGSFEARVRNLSAGGLMAEAAVAANRGDPVEVNLRNVGWVFGTVAWSTGNRFGVAFNAPIDPKLVRKPVGGNNESISIVHRPDAEKLRKLRHL